MCGKVKDSVDLVLTQASENVLVLCHVAMEELEVWPAFEHAGIVQGAAIVQFVERDHIVAGILGHQMPDEPGCDEAFSAGHQNVSYVRKWVEAILSCEYRRVPP